MATLSKDVSEEQHEGRHSLEYSRHGPMATMSGPANVSLRPKSPEIAGHVSSYLRRSIPPVLRHGRFMSNIANIPTLTIPSQERLTNSVGPPPDSSPKLTSHSAPQTYLPPSFTRPTSQLMSLVELAPHFSSCSLTCPYPSIRKPSVVPSSSPAQKILHLELPSIHDRRVRGEPEDSSDENPRRFGISENGRTATERSRLFIDCLSDFTPPLESIRSYVTISPFHLAEEHAPDGSSATRTRRLLSNRNDDANKFFFRSFRSYRTATESEPYSSGGLFSKLDPPLPLRIIIDRSDSNSQFRSSGRMELIPPSPQAVSPVTPCDLSIRTSDFLRRLSYSQGTWYIMQNASVLLPPSLGVPDSVLPPNFSVRTTQGTLVSLEGEACRHADGTTLQPSIFFINRNSWVGSWLPTSSKTVAMTPANGTMRHHLREEQRHRYVSM